MVVFFDGECTLCNGAVDFLIARDRRRRLTYAPLQGRTARERLPARLVNDLDTLALEDRGRIYVESTAALRTIAALGFPWTLVRILLVVPRFARDGVYRWIARHRDRWFGRRATCRRPTPEEQSFFLE